MESNKVFAINIAAIRPNPGQPRRIFDTEGLRELAESIKEYGIIQPLSIRKTEGGAFELIAGERRLRAAKLAGLTEVPCILLGTNEKQSSLIALVENLQRCDLDYFEEAEGIQRLIHQFGLSQDEASQRLGKSQSALANKLRLLRHPPEIVQSIRENGLTERHARALLRIEDVSQRKTVLDSIVESHMNVAQTDEYIDTLLVQSFKPDENLTPKQQIRTLYVFKDMRLFLNTINRAVDMIRKSGVTADMDKQESQEEIVLTIKIPKKVS